MQLTRDLFAIAKFLCRYNIVLRNLSYIGRYMETSTSTGLTKTARQHDHNIYNVRYYIAPTTAGNVVLLPMVACAFNFVCNHATLYLRGNG